MGRLFFPINRRMKFARIVIVSILAALLFAVTQHHHDDFNEHEDCPACVLVQGGFEFNDFTPQVTLFWIPLFELVSEKNTCKINSHIYFYRSRGPPDLAA